jgi:hypothetical protein
MKNIFVIFSLITMLSSFAANAQFNKQEKRFLHWFLNKYKQSKKPILYVPNQDISKMLDLIKADTLLDIWGFAGDNQPQHKLVLTKNEKRYVAAELNQLRGMEWVDHLLPGARLLSQDTVNYYLGDKIYGWQRMYDRGIYGFYTFSKPVFLRNETFCIFQYDFNCGVLCGSGKITVYRKVNGKWTHYINLYNWIS